MACPYFDPLNRASERPGYRLPLGSLWLGACCSPLADAAPRSADHQREVCNVGYARGRCTSFPEDAESDAVRFAQRPEGVVFILEKGHAPVSWGPAAEIPPGTLLDRQLKAWNTI
ncbi:MAG: hypothetical protein SFV54_02920 [Bryobacteraceae bacterium]|nr:hypothetical protein [Bryobacteraceae bacterium]